MKRFFFAIPFFLFHLSASHAAFGFSSLQLWPEAIYTYEEKPVTFIAKPNPSSTPRGAVLVQWDPEKEKVLYRWKMTDDGSLGDVRAGDGIYSRTVQFNERKGGVKIFSVVEGNDEVQAAFLKKEDLGPQASLHVLHQPTFLEIMSQVWQKIKAHFSK
ncbi:MAG: choice-of-anchor X domain-containing protein [bacterium]